MRHYTYSCISLLTDLDGNYVFENQNDGSMITLLQGKDEYSRTNLGSCSSKSGANQEWVLEKTAANIYVIKVGGNENVMDVLSYEKVHGSCFPVGIADPFNTQYSESQLWIFERRARDTFVIRNRANSLVLDVFLDESIDGSQDCHQIGVCPSRSQSSQSWILKPFKGI